MNLLAHAYLSFNNSGILVGNMISDYVKGKQKFAFPAIVQQGIHLHRMIDTFTDGHAVTHAAKQVFRPAYRLYSGAFVDVVYDHFLALDENEFPEGQLFSFTQQVYATLERHKEWMPPPFAQMFPHMKSNNWLYNYRQKQGIQRSFGGLVHRSAYLQESDTAFALFENNYQLLYDCYRQFWQDLKSFAASEYMGLAPQEPL